MQTAGALEAQLSRMSKENRMLSEKLAAVYKDHNVVRGQLINLMNISSSEKGAPSPSRKRKADSLETVSADAVPDVGKATCWESSSPREDDLCKKPWEESKVKISKAYVRTTPADTSLVSI